MAATRRSKVATRRTPRRSTRARQSAAKQAPARRNHSVHLPQLELTEGQQREGFGLLLIVLALIFLLAVLFSPGAGLTRLRGFLLDAVGLGWIVVVAVLVGGGLAMIAGRRVTEGGEDSPRVSRNWVAVLLGMALLTLAILGLLQLLLLSPAQWHSRGSAAGGFMGTLVATPLNNTLTAWGAAIVLLAAGVFGAMLSFDLSLASLGHRVRTLVGPEEGEAEVAEHETARDAHEEAAEKEHKPTLLEQLFAEPARPERDEVVAEREPEPLFPDLPDNPVADDDAAEARAQAEAEWAAAAQEAKGEHDESPRVWTLPPISLLDPIASKQEKLQQEVKHNIEVIETTLLSFGVVARVRGVNSGASVTQYELEPAKGVPVRKITALQNDLALALAAPIRIQAPIPGKSAVGVEVPNKASALVTLREITQSPAFQNPGAMLTMPIGSDVSGQPIIGDLAKMPHVLIAGATGSGKSVCINALLAGFMLRNSPDQLRFILIDPKRVELSLFRDLPHLLVPVVTEADHAVAALRWAVTEMENRYKLFASHAVRNIAGYNAKAPEIGLEQIPNIVIVIDELADLMMVAGNEVEELICRVAQLARAVGIHLIVATQRPSADIITGLIKANIPSRIAFAVSSGIDSRVVLDETGAEKLLGRGDMLYLPVDAGKAIRIQGVMVSDTELNSIIAHWKVQGAPTYQEEIFNLVATVSWAKEGARRDPMFERAARIVASEGRAATSLLQRKLSIGYTRAARIIDQLADHGVVGPYEGSKSREVLMSLPELDVLFERLESSGDPVQLEEFSEDRVPF